MGPNVEVTDDNNNVDGGLGNVTPSKDAQNRQSNETTVAISNQDSPVTGLRVGDIDRGRSRTTTGWCRTFGDTWMGIHLSFDGGTTWFGAPPFPNGYNTMVPGFPTDTSAAGLASPLLGLDGAGDPVDSLRPQRQPARRRNRVQPQPRSRRASARHSRFRREVQVHAGDGGDREHDDKRRLTRRTSPTGDGHRRPRRSRLRSPEWVRGQLHRQAVDGGRSQLTVGEPVLGQRLLRRHELPRSAGRLSDRL